MLKEPSWQPAANLRQGEVPRVDSWAGVLEERAPVGSQSGK
jgi:hypothetical protein